MVNDTTFVEVPVMRLHPLSLTLLGYQSEIVSQLKMAQRSTVARSATVKSHSSS